MKRVLSPTLTAIAAAAFLLCSAPVLAAGNTSQSKPHYCSRNSVTNSDPGSGTNAGTLGIKTNVSSSEANPAAAPVQPNTPANTTPATSTQVIPAFIQRTILAPRITAHIRTTIRIHLPARATRA